MKNGLFNISSASSGRTTPSILVLLFAKLLAIAFGL